LRESGRRRAFAPAGAVGKRRAMGEAVGGEWEACIHGGWMGVKQ